MCWFDLTKPYGGFIEYEKKRKRMDLSKMWVCISTLDEFLPILLQILL